MCACECGQCVSASACSKHVCANIFFHFALASLSQCECASVHVRVHGRVKESMCVHVCVCMYMCVVVCGSVGANKVPDMLLSPSQPVRKKTSRAGPFPVRTRERER